MITSISKLGQLALTSNPAKNSLLENPNSSGNYPLVYCLSFSGSNKGFRWQGVKVEEFDNSNFTKYLFRRGSSRGANFSPTAHIVEVDKTFINKILGWFRTVLKAKEILSEYDFKYIGELYDFIKRNETNIIKDLSEKASRSNDGKIVTLLIDGKYLGDIDVFKKVLTSMVYSKDMVISSKDKVCSVCGELKEIVLGNSSPFAFYTIDKPGFISGEFDELQAWRNFPICIECKQNLEEGKRILETNLKFSFYGLSYLLIPTFYFMGEHNREIIDLLMEDTSKSIRLNQKTRRRLNMAEEDILDLLSEFNDTLSFTLLFVRKPPGTRAERILLNIDEIFPSRLKQLFVAKDETDKIFNIISEKGYHFGRLREFFAKSNQEKRDNDLDKYFLELINKIFRGVSVELTFLIPFMMKEIRSAFVNISGSNETENKFYWKSRNALMNVIFLSKLNLIVKEGINMEESKFQQLFEKYGPHLGSPEKRGIFLLGALTQMLLNYQSQKRGTDAFRKQLMGLKMGEREIKGLLPKVINKFEEYGAFYKSRKLVAEEISRLLLSSTSPWKSSVDEINFYFVCGMNLYKELGAIIYENKEEFEEVLQNVE